MVLPLASMAPRCDPGLGEKISEAIGLFGTVVGRISSSDDGERKLIAFLEFAFDVNDGWGIGTGG